MEETRSDLKKKIEDVHEKHAWTLAFLVFAIAGAIAYGLDHWLARYAGHLWAELAHFALYVACFFAVFGLGWLKDAFLGRLMRKR
ncbi:hypothetical protein [Pseudomonas aeruginosa]|uniref:hypothetical protein n=1 Tax=Pseudomonas aeruginosa TaxID=287 RepID=UPI0028FFB944|nr:hypothetical protein [Pseudomonas aeruginosa]MDU0513590.1 hypothetical protein [Pseudomonas aeruginosa]